jgi:xylulokinase
MSVKPASLAEAALVTTPKDWLRGQLTGDRSGERSDASATLLWDVVADTWLPEALDLAGISSEVLPALAASDAVIGRASCLLRVPRAGRAFPW